MISFELYSKIRHYYCERGLSLAQIARELHIRPETVARWARAKSYTPRALQHPRSSKLDPHKPLIVRWLETHPYSATQILQRLRDEAGYTGGFSILKEYIRRVHPVRHPAFLTLAFAPGECAQVDWGCAGTMAVGSTTRRLSFFVMVLAYSRMIYVEFTLGEATEHFLGCHQNAFEFFGGVPEIVLVDNLKSAVTHHPHGDKAVFNPRYLDFAAHYGFEPRACNVRKANEKGRVENGVGYVKKNFLAGLELPPSLGALNIGARRWMDSTANIRIHGETRKPPLELFVTEKALLKPLTPLPPDTSVTRTVPVNNRCRVVLDTNRYSVPSLYASRQLTLRCFADRLCLYHEGKLVATHPRSYERHRDCEDPEHAKELLERRGKARQAKALLSFYGLSPRAEEYALQLQERRLNSRQHIAKILALSEAYGREKVARAIEDAFEFQAFSSDYIANLLEQRERFAPQPGPLHLTRRTDLLELELPLADLAIYDPPASSDPPLKPI